MRLGLRRLLRTFRAENAPDFPEIEAFSWSPPPGHRNFGYRNFGDHLARVIVSKVLADHGHLLEEEVVRPCRLFSVGSVMHFARSGDVVWGSGVNGKEMDDSRHVYEHLDVRAVRGPLTREFLGKRGIAAPEVFGDPALLLPHLFPGRFIRTGTKSHVVVPNLHDLKTVVKQGVADVVSPLQSWNRCVEQILQAQFVVASSLHGIVIAEAFGIPARYVRLSEWEKPFKYDDYALGTGRDRMEFARSIEEALEMGGMKPPSFDHKALLAAFPIDLWRPVGTCSAIVANALGVWHSSGDACLQQLRKVGQCDALDHGRDVERTD
ncbi:polysaccharide pyruvyl transferase family protein [Povalibacter sp.]|uniref:polysaccharide pyruvyl transferase family protein n=1 Tax=Povalibacter sp. TaxID=1962978 RepID=UPI002F4086DA